MENLILLKRRMMEATKSLALKKFIEEETEIRPLLLLYSRMVLSQVLKIHPSGCSPQKLREGCLHYCVKHYREERQKLEKWEALFAHADSEEIWYFPGVVICWGTSREDFLEIVEKVCQL